MIIQSIGVWALVLVLIGNHSADAGMLKGGLKMIQAGAKLVHRQFPSPFETSLLKSGKAFDFAGRKVIRRNSTFTPDSRDAFGKTNVTRMSEGKSPIGKDGVEVQLHHYQQRENGPIIEMMASEHRSHSNELHRYTRESEIERQAFNRWKADYWRKRSQDFE